MYIYIYCKSTHLTISAKWRRIKWKYTNFSCSTLVRHLLYSKSL